MASVPPPANAAAATAASCNASASSTLQCDNLALLKTCNHSDPLQQWRYEDEGSDLKQLGLFVTPCNSSDPAQTWSVAKGPPGMLRQASAGSERLCAQSTAPNPNTPSPVALASCDGAGAHTWTWQHDPASPSGLGHIASGGNCLGIPRLTGPDVVLSPCGTAGTYGDSLDLFQVKSDGMIELATLEYLVSGPKVVAGSGMCLTAVHGSPGGRLVATDSGGENWCLTGQGSPGSVKGVPCDTIGKSVEGGIQSRWQLWDNVSMSGGYISSGMAKLNPQVSSAGSSGPLPHTRYVSAAAPLASSSEASKKRSQISAPTPLQVPWPFSQWVWPAASQAGGGMIRLPPGQTMDDNDNAGTVRKVDSGKLCLTLGPSGNLEVWATSLTGGRFGVLLLNRSPVAAAITAHWRDIGAPAQQRMEVLDVWRAEHHGSVSRQWTDEHVPARGCTLLVLTPRLVVENSSMSNGGAAVWDNHRHAGFAPLPPSKLDDDAGRPPTAPAMQLTKLGQTVKASMRAWFAEQAKLTSTGGAVFTAPPYAPLNGTGNGGHGSSSTCNLSGTWHWAGWGPGAPMVFAEQPSGGEQPASPSFTITPPANWSWHEAHGVFHRDGTLSIDYGGTGCKPNVGPPCQVNGSVNSRCDLITVSRGLPGHGTFRRESESGSMRYYSPDNASDPRTHYAGTYIRDFFYTFSMAPDILPAADISNTLDYFFSGQDRSTGSVSEGGTPPNRPINAVNCWDEGPFLALAAAKYATLFGDSAWLCGEHPAGGGRVQRLQQALQFLNVPSGKPNLVVAPTPHCMYGFTDMEPKQGHVLFTSLLVVQAGFALSAAIDAAAAKEAAGCTRGMSAWFEDLATTINASIADGFLDDHRPGGSGLLLATDSAGHNSLPDVWGSGLAVAIGAGTDAQRAALARALAENADSFMRWGQARHLPLPLCWQVAGVQHPGAANTNQCTETGKEGWCRGEPCGSYQNGGYGPLNYRTAARTLFLRPYLAHFCPVFSRFFAVFSRLDASIPESGTKRPGAGSVTVENGRGKSGRRRPILGG
eukprot:COSAG04_NODE_1335_length_7178_cov_14.567679_7_plen_1040_part_00